MLERLRPPVAPWYVVPSDSKKYRNWAVTRLLLRDPQRHGPHISAARAGPRGAAGAPGPPGSVGLAHQQGDRVARPARRPAAASASNRRPVIRSVTPAAEIQARVAPAAAALEPHRQAGGDGDRPAAVESHGMVGRVPARQQRRVPGEQLRTVPPQPQGCAIRARAWPGRWRRPAAAGAAVERARARRRRAPKSTGRRLSGSTRRVLPQFGALIDVRYAGHGQLHQLLGQRVRPPAGVIRCDQAPRAASRTVGSVVGGVDRARAPSASNVGVRVDPAGLRPPPRAWPSRRRRASARVR